MITDKGSGRARQAGVLHSVGFLPSILILAAACSSAPRITTAGELIAKLQDAGIQIDTQSPAPKPSGDYFRFDEGIRVTGPDLLLDVLRIEDRRVFDIAKSAGKLLVVTDAVAGRHIPDNPSIFARHPFVVAVRLQPGGTHVEQILAKLLPPERE
jgi:hypothetical protein